MKRDTPYAKAVEKLLNEFVAAVFGDHPPEKPLVVVVAGGAAVHLYTGARVSKDLDAEFLARVLKPDVVVAYTDSDGTERTVHLDRTYTTTLGLLHEDYLDRSGLTGWTVPGLEVRVMSPVDLAISKLARWAEHDQADVRSLIDAGLLNRDSFERLANEALSYFVGNTMPVRRSIEEALSMFPAPRAVKGAKP
ncbi:F420-0:gamma-glutamyl ligase-like protein [Roseateles asaccharophilus]|uniref:DUF6036 family nucleotidyltransferase n=1 Tax=Roseateles asaccharophilus TaxID=582607 RepID=UPI0038388F2E